jgi:uncharacterized protein (TIGR02466 family)
MIGIFATPLEIVKFERDLSSEEKDFICNQNKFERNSKFTFQSENTKLLDSVILSDLRTFCENSINKFFQEIYKPSTNVSLKITQSWANYAKNGQEHIIHLHQNSIISGVFYVNTNQNDKIIFCRNTSMRHFKIETEEYNSWNSDELWFSSEEGNLLLFPSLLAHRVPEAIGEKERISISFNTFFSGEIGHERALTQLIV